MNSMTTLTPEQLKPEHVLHFWFDKSKNSEEQTQFWFAGKKETDALIAKYFESCVEAAAEGNFHHWQNKPDSCLALILLLDQFPLNIYRGSRRSFETIRLALPYAKHAIDNEFDQGRTVEERLFFYLPFEHAEDLEMQRKSMFLFGKMHDEAQQGDKQKAKFFLDYAKLHFDVIAKFGRFPTWNNVLERVSTPEESKHLAEGGSGF